MRRRARLGLGLLLALSACADPFPTSKPQAIACAPDDPRALLGRAGLETACSVELPPGESVVVKVPPGHDLVARANRALRPDDLSIGVSNGTGVVAFPEFLLAGFAAILPSRTEPVLARVSRPEGTDTRLHLTFKLSHEPEKTVRYGREVFLPGPKVAVRQLTDGDDERFTALRPRAPMRFDVSGPSVLAVRTRALFDTNSDWVEEYRLEATLDGIPEAVLNYEATPDLTATAAESISGATVGTAETEYLVIPEGRHSVTLSAPRTVLARVRTRPDLARGNRRDWSAMPPDPGSALAGCVDPDVLEARARRIATDNERMGGGLVAAAWLADLAARAPDDRELPAAAARIRGAYTFFRDLVPESPGGLAQQTAYVAVPRLASDEREDHIASGVLPTSTLLDRLVRAVFVPAPGSAAPLSFVLPPREAATELRLVVDQSELRSPARLFVSFDGAPPVPVLVLPGRELADAAYLASPAEVGLARLAGETGVPAARVTTTERFGDYQPPGPLLKAGTLALPLPAGVGRVRIWAEDPGMPLRVALQYRAATTPQLSEAGYRATLAMIGPDRARALFGEATDAALTCDAWLDAPARCGFVQRVRGAPPALRVIYNDWIPILRLLRARERTLFASLLPKLRVAPDEGASGAEERISGAISEAQAAARAGHWQEALELWAEVGRDTSGALWARAQIGQAEALIGLDETYLAERLLKNVYLTAFNPASRRNAYGALADLLRTEEATEDLVGLHAAEYGRHPDPEVLRRLSSTLAEAGQAEMAAKLALLLPGPNTVAGSLAERAGWAEPSPDRSRPVTWQTAEELVSRSAGAVGYLATARGTYGQLYKTTPGQPLRLEVEGPTRLRIAMRPLHGTGDRPIDGWIRIEGPGVPIDVPVSDNHPTSGIELFGVGGQAGIAVTETLAVPEGRHVVTVAPERITLLVGVEQMAGPDTENQRAKHRLGSLLRDYETGSADRPALLADAAVLAHRHATDPAVRSAWQDFERLSRWERIENVTRSAGSRAIALTEPTESPSLRTRLALLPPFTPGERLVQSDGETAVSVINPDPVEIGATLALDTVPTRPSQPVTVSYRVDDKAPQSVRLSSSDPTRTLSIDVPAGEHVIRFSVEERHANQFVRLRLRDAEGREIDTERRRSHEVATEEEPVVLTLEGPAWLRIDRHRAGRTEREYRYIEPGLQTVTVGPEAGREEALLRLFRLVPDLEPGDPAPRTPIPSERVPSATMPRTDLATCRVF